MKAKKVKNDQLLDSIFNESCIDTMKRIPDNFVDVVITSPPYNNPPIYKGYTFNFEGIAKELYSVVKEGGGV